MARNYFSYTVVKADQTLNTYGDAVLTCLEDVIWNAYFISANGDVNETSVFPSKTGGANITSRITSYNGVIEFWAEPGEYKITVTDPLSRISDKDIFWSSVSGQDGGIPGTKISNDNSLVSNQIQDGTIATADIGALQVTNAKLAADSVTTAKIANDAIIASKIADATITAAKLAPGAGFSLLDSQTFTSSANYTIPATAELIVMEAIGAGSGGSAGVDNTGSAGGGGGAGGTLVVGVFSTAYEGLNGVVEVIIGAGGAGGVGTSMNAGSPGGKSAFGPIYIPGAPSSPAGYTRTSGASWESIFSFYLIRGASGGDGFAASTSGEKGYIAGGGGGGGMSNTASAAGAGGSGGATNLETVYTTTRQLGGGGAGGTGSSGAAGAAGTGRSGGGGGGKSTSGVAGTGGAGGVGAGGGGGGASSFGADSAGSGGAGGRGEISIKVYG